MRKFIIGDIHGAYKALMQCLEIVNFDYDNDTLIQIGDVCDGWSETHLVIKELSKIKNMIQIKGNHDEWAFRFLDVSPKLGMDEYHSWFKHGGSATLKSYKSLSNDDKIFFKNYLKTALPYYIDENNNAFVHAGYTRLLSVNRKDYTLEMDKYNGILMWDRTMWEDAVLYNSSPDDKRFNKVFIGHSPTIIYGKSKPMNIQNIWNVDTGAAFYGPLTIMNVDTLEYYQSDYCFKLYPKETGRNKMTFEQLSIDKWNAILGVYDINI
jgi:serine/threonine protein phosphatase 1